MQVKEIESLNIIELKYFGFFFLFIFMFLISDCTSENQIDKETLVKIYVDKLIAEEQYLNNDSLKIKTEEIFKKYSVTKNEYVNAIKSLDYDKEKWEEFFKLSKAYIDTLKSEIEKKKDEKQIK